MVLAVPSAALTKRVSQGCRDPNHDSVSGYQCADCLREHRYVDVDMSDHRCGTETCLAMAVVDIPLAHHSSLGRARDHLHTAEELHGRKPRDRLARGLDGVATAAELVDVPVTVLVILDACTDHSEEVIPQWVHVLSVSARNVGAARAAGFLAAAPTLTLELGWQRIPTAWCPRGGWSNR